MIKRIPVFMIVMLFLVVSAFAKEADSLDTVFETNLSGWVNSGDGEFGEKTDYYKKNGKFMSSQTVQYTYAVADKEITGNESFTFNVEFDVPNYDTSGAEKGWCWQTILFGVQNVEDPSADTKGGITFQHYPEGSEMIIFSSGVSEANDSFGMTDEMMKSMAHRLIISYSKVRDAIEVFIDGEQCFLLEDARDDIKGKLGFGATWCCMRITKAVYTEYDETPLPTTPTPEKTNTPVPTKSNTLIPTGTDTPDKNMFNNIYIVAIALIVVVIIAVVIVIIKVAKKK